MFNTSLNLENSKPHSEYQWKCTLAYTQDLDSYDAWKRPLLHVSYCNGRRLFHMDLRLCFRIRLWISCARYWHSSEFVGVNNCLSSRLVYPVMKAVKWRPETYTTKSGTPAGECYKVISNLKLAMSNSVFPIPSNTAIPKIYVAAVNTLRSESFPCGIYGGQKWHCERIYLLWALSFSPVTVIQSTPRFVYVRNTP